MEGRYKVIFEVEMSEEQKDEVNSHVSEAVEKVFGTRPENLKVKKMNYYGN